MKMKELERALDDERVSRKEQDKHYLEQFEHMLKLKKQKEALDLNLPKPLHKSKKYQKKLQKARKKSRQKKQRRKKSKPKGGIRIVGTQQLVDSYRETLNSERYSQREPPVVRPRKIQELINRGKPILPEDFKEIPGGEDLTWNQKLDIMRAALGGEKMPNYMRETQQKKVKFSRDSEYHDLRASNGFLEGDDQANYFKTFNTMNLANNEKIKINDKLNAPSPEEIYNNLYNKQKPRLSPKKKSPVKQIVAKDQNLDKIEAQLKEIRENLKPLINQFNKDIPARNPHAELMEVACGRLMKVHSEKLIETLIDELIEETIEALNQLEVDRKLKEESEKIKSLCYEINKNLRGIDVQQKHHFIDTNTLEKFHKKISVKENLRYLRKDDYMNLDMIQKEKRNAHFLADGPYEGYFAKKTDVRMLESEVKAIKLKAEARAKIISDNETFRKSDYIQGSEVVGEKIIEEVFKEVIAEFVKAQDQFVKLVVDAEFS